MLKLRQFGALGLLTLSLGLASCGGGGASTGAFDLPSDGGTGGGDGSFDTSKFAVGVSNTYSHHVRKSTSFAEDCSIASNAASSSIDCYIDVNEADLYFNGVTLAYGAPAGMCNYVRHTPYWYYNYETGYGPSTLAVSIDKETINGETLVTDMNCSVNGSGWAACNTYSELSVKESTGEVGCAYNGTASNRPNCCLGEYTKTETIVTVNGATTGVTTDTIEGEWGTSIKSCLGGQGKTNWSLYSENGFPSAIVWEATNGLSKTASVSKVDSTIGYGVIYPVSNYYTTTGSPHLHTGYGAYSGTSSTIPPFIDPISDRSGTLMIPGSPAYRFECLDRAYEVLQRINVYVRDWDSYTDYLAYINGAGTPEVPDRPTSSEGTGCGGISGGCNDMYDADDFLDLIYGGPYVTTPGSETTRYLLFPRDKYK